MNSTILLDFDGVIVDSIELFCKAVNVAGRKLNRRVSFEPEDLRNIKRMSIPEISNVAGIEKKLMRVFVTEIDGELYRRADEIPMFQHMTDVIEKLSMVGSLGIVSATSRPVISKVLQNYGIERFVRHIAGGDMPGAKSVKIKSIIQENGSRLDNACMVGDTVSDIEQAKIAGVATIAVSWGWHGIEWLRTANPDYEVHQPLDLIERVQQVVAGEQYSIYGN